MLVQPIQYLMKFSNHQIKYFAWEITRIRSSTDADRISQSLFDAQVDINPHQIEAALFALQNPLSKGVILADEVGLGKTIEAALVLCQYWAERKRNLLIICPASLRKQWAQELQDKFNLPTQVLDSRTWSNARKEGVYNPFQDNKISIISYNFAARMEHALGLIPWDLVVIDEAHKLRNAHRPSNKIGNSLRKSLAGSKKLLLTATPLQNSLMELYGLSTVIDEHLFGDDKSFRAQYSGEGGDLKALRMRLEQFVQRTLRKDVLEYVPYTERLALTVPFTPSDEEQYLYDAVTEYLQRDVSYAFPQQQRHLISIVVRKLLASSTVAVISTLETIKKRLKSLLADQEAQSDWLLSDLFLKEELDEELIEDAEENQLSPEVFELNKASLQGEIAEIESYLDIARKIKTDKKSEALLSALDQGFARMFEMGAQRKAVIFTESRRTQEYLVSFLEKNGFAGKVIAFNGSNNTPASTGIYQNWLLENNGSSKVTGSPAIDRRTALIDFFKDKAEILVATEAAAEGVNLQFCSLVINYDLPWNPQRVEQRIGRCHRYGQKFDVVVVNFLNKRNEVDQRVLELLSEKFHLFDGVFGASNDILGAVENGSDFEKSIADIYNQCRTPEEIESSFKKLREELEAQINEKMRSTQELLLEHFDADIHDVLKIRKEKTEQQLDRVSKYFWSISKHILKGKAEFDDSHYCFNLTSSPRKEINSGQYMLIQKGKRIPEKTYVYRLTHPLGEYVLDQAKGLKTDYLELVFDYAGYGQKVSALESLKSKQGWLAVTLLRIKSFQDEEHLVLTGITDEDEILDNELCERLLRIGMKEQISTNKIAPDYFRDQMEREVKIVLNKVLEANQEFFQEEREKLEAWADDRLLAVEKALDDIKIKIRSLKRDARRAPDLETEKRIQEELKKAERQQRRMRQDIFDAEDEIEEKRDQYIEQLEAGLHQSNKEIPLFMVRWSVV